VKETRIEQFIENPPWSKRSCFGMKPKVEWTRYFW